MASLYIPHVAACAPASAPTSRPMKRDTNGGGRDQGAAREARPAQAARAHRGAGARPSPERAARKLSDWPAAANAASRPPLAPSVVILLADGARPDTFAAALDDGTL